MDAGPLRRTHRRSQIACPQISLHQPSTSQARARLRVIKSRYRIRFPRGATVADQLHVELNNLAKIIDAYSFVNAVNPLDVFTLQTHRNEAVNLIGDREIPPGVSGHRGQPGSDKCFGKDLVDRSLQRMKCRGADTRDFFGPRFTDNTTLDRRLTTFEPQIFCDLTDVSARVLRRVTGQ